MKKLLIIGAGFLQTFIIRKAKDMGYYTITIDKNADSIGFKFADEYSVIDIVDQEECLKFATSKNIDGVLTAATDYGVLSAAYIADQLNLPGINYEVAKIIKNKYQVRRLLFENKVDDIAQFFEINDSQTLDQISSNINFPVMVKPCDGSGSKAARKVDSIEKLHEACDEAIKSSLIGKALIEDFIDGKEFGVESFVYNGEIHVLAVMGKEMTSPPIYAELGHCIPSQLIDEKKVKEVVIKAIKTLGINYGAVNMDVLVTNDNKVCIVDIGARMGGNLIGSHIIPLGTGIDYMGLLIGGAVADPIKLKAKDTGPYVVTRLLALTKGEVKALPDVDEIKEECGVEIYHNLKVGSKIREYQNNLDGCGYVISVSYNKQEAKQQAEKAKKLFDIGIIRK